MTLEQLEELRVALVRAQREENACVRKLNAFVIASSSDRNRFDQLAVQCHSARQKSQAAYEAWTRAVERYQTQAAYAGAGTPPDDAASRAPSTS